MKKIISALLLTTILINTTACGTILHPERKGQRQGEIDLRIAVFNGIGLIFFLIPGVIAYAVDFNNGTIYLPNRRTSLNHDVDIKNMTALHVGKGNLSNDNIRNIIETKTGKNITPDSKIEAYKIEANGKRTML